MLAFSKGIWGEIADRTVETFVLVAGILGILIGNHWSLKKILEGQWESIAIGITAISALVIWHAFRSAYAVSGEIGQEHAIGFGAEPLRVSFPRTKLYGIAVCLTFLAGTASMLIWELSNKKVAAPKNQTPAELTTPALKPTFLSSKCTLPKDFSPCEIKCSAYNPHDAAMSNVSIGFNGIYPYQTRLAAGTETHMAIKKQETLPLPMSGGYLDQSLLAFSVELPLIPPKTSLSFTLWSTSEVNQKTCEYLKTTVRSDQKRKIDALIEIAAGEKQKLDAGRMVSLQAKKTSLFIPGYSMSSEGRRKVEFITDDEEKNAKGFDVFYKRDGKSLQKESCLAPVFAAERTDGNPQYFINAPPMMTWSITTFKEAPLPAGGFKLESDPRPPERYSCEPINN